MFIVKYDDTWEEDYPWCVFFVDDDYRSAEPFQQFSSKENAEMYVELCNAGMSDGDALRRIIIHSLVISA